MEFPLVQRMSHRNLPQQFLKARDALMAHFRPIINHYGLTEQQWRILRALDEAVQLEPREICEQCQMLSSSMPGVLARMEAMGLIARNRVETDQRRLLVRLTPEGDRLIGEMTPLIEQQYQNIELAFGKRTFDALEAALEGFIRVQGKRVQQVALPARQLPAEADA